MATRSSALSRSVEFFRSANLDEARVAFQLVKEAMEQRLAKSAQPSLPFNKTRTRKPKTKVGQAGHGAVAPAGPGANPPAAAAAAAAPASLSMREQEQTLADA